MSAATQTKLADDSRTDAKHDRLGENTLTEFAFNQARVKGGQLAPRPEFADCDPEDIEQELLMYLIQKADQFDPSRAKLNTFISRVLDSGVRELLRAKKRQKRHPLQDDIRFQSFGQPVDTVDGSYADLGGEISHLDQCRRTMGIPMDSGEHFDERDAVAVALSTLPREKRDFILFLADHTQAETQRHCRISRRKANKWRDEIAEHFEQFDATFFWE